MIVALTPGWVKTGAYYFQLHDGAGALQCMKLISAMQTWAQKMLR